GPFHIGGGIPLAPGLLEGTRAVNARLTAPTVGNDVDIRGDQMGQCDDVTLAICTSNRVKLLEEKLAFLGGINAPSAFRVEAAVVDNNSTDTTRDLVARVAASFPTRLDYVFEPRQGKSHAMNAGARASTSPVLAFVDDDVRVAREWLTVVAESFRDDPDIKYI